MEIIFWGVRGTVPVSGNDVVKYGGRTPCASVVSSGGEIIIIDAGTGIKALGDHLMSKKINKPLQLHLFLTHFHLDHVMGLPFFAPLYSPEVMINFYAFASRKDIQKYLGGLMAGKYFPFEFNETLSTKEFQRIPREYVDVGGIQVSHHRLNHPQGSIALSLKEGVRKIVFATDTEHLEEKVDERLAAFAEGADVFVYDAMFTPEEYRASKQGWGHSTWLEGTKLAKEARVGELRLSHFNPRHSDKKIDRMISLARKEFPRTAGAREGLKIILK